MQMPTKSELSKTMHQAPRILLISHALGGGAEEHVADLRGLLSPALDVEVLLANGCGIFIDHRSFILVASS